ncbi:alpha/beta fold hydrolase [Psychrobacillus vulpis]|uniref:Alpha/beta hydrolase n=1 Tax=Psychrobacillus vulpis TaxID=2325572 RepID=A0A544TMQ1_9BACI|nr:alpha/beta hydrolase [Psychrobacillus vulpis]TQR18690.1 alpha/beta hydrolase [Psychrobacillus vulpis]
MLLQTSITGVGEPIVFLHTGLQTGLTDYTFQREYFTKSYKVIAPDLRGHGQSKTNDIQNFFEDSALDLLETIDHYHLETIHLVGCSLGAIVAMKFAQLYPERINTLTISGITPVKPENWSVLHSEDVEFQGKLLENEEFTSYFDQLHVSDWRQFIYLGRDEDWYPFEDMKTLNECNFPVLFIVGEGNQHETIGASIYPKENKNVHIAIIPFAAHLVHEEQPEIYTRILEEFLEQSKKK